MQHIGHVELKEFLYASTHAKGISGRTMEENTKQMRDVLRFHRFDVCTWLMCNGVQIPAHLMSDDLHKQVGDQLPDQPCPPSSSTGQG